MRGTEEINNSLDFFYDLIRNDIETELGKHSFFRGDQEKYLKEEDFIH